MLVSDGWDETTIDLGVRGAFGALSESRIQIKSFKPWGLVIQVRPSFVCINRWVRSVEAWAGFMTANVDIKEVKIAELDSKLSTNFLFIHFLIEHL